MPFNVGRVYSSLLTAVLGIAISASAQTVPPTSVSPSPVAQTQAAPVIPIEKAPTAAEIIRDRISKAKAFIAVRNYNAANYELESIRRESADASLLSVVNVLLMNSYLEQGDYKRAQELLNESFNIQKTTKPGAAATYFAVASQIVKGARTRVERYRALGLNPSDRTLPLEAINDLEKMRETLEVVITQSKEISKDKTRTPDAMALLEEASTSRSMMARDDYDARKWQNELADTREDLANSRSVVLSAVNEAPTTTAPATQAIAQNTPIVDTSYKPAAATPVSNQPLVKPTVMSQPINDPAKTNPAPQYVPEQQPARNRAVQGQPSAQTLIVNKPDPQTADQPSVGPSKDSPLNVGPLVAYVTKQSQPQYPAPARAIRASGIVKVDVLIDEQGNVAEIQGVSGPPLLQGAAKDAIRKWHFKPFIRDGQPVRATGFINFNFTL